MKKIIYLTSILAVSCLLMISSHAGKGNIQNAGNEHTQNAGNEHTQNKKTSNLFKSASKKLWNKLKAMGKERPPKMYASELIGLIENEVHRRYKDKKMTHSEFMKIVNEQYRQYVEKGLVIIRPEYKYPKYNT